MSNQARKRRAVIVDDEDEPAQTQTQRRQNGRQTQETQNGRGRRNQQRQEEEEEEEEEEESLGDGDEMDEDDHQTNLDLAVRNLIRLALASEHNRQPIRRNSEQVNALMRGSRIKWNTVLKEAQKKLAYIYGMELAELPTREKVTMSQKRAAARVEKTTTSTKAYVLRSILPQQYRTAKILGGQLDSEAAYMGFVTMVISIIYLSKGQVSENVLDRHFARLKIDGESKALGQTSKVLDRMERNGYLQKIKDSSSGDTSIEYKVGPRGKVEIGVEGVVECIKKMWGPDPELEKRIKQSLGEDVLIARQEEEEEPTQTQTQTQRGTQGTQRAARGRNRAQATQRNGRGRRQDEDEEEEEEYESD